MDEIIKFVLQTYGPPGAIIAVLLWDRWQLAKKLDESRDSHMKDMKASWDVISPVKEAMLSQRHTLETATRTIESLAAELRARLK